MKILVTGGAGFIGSNFIRYMLEEHPDYRIVNLDLLTYAGNLENLADLEGCRFVRGDIADTALLENGTTSKKSDRAAVAKAACHHAVRANDQLTLDEAKALIKQMSECELPFSCPHGRPTVINISYKELEKRFGRK